MKHAISALVGLSFGFALALPAVAQETVSVSSGGKTSTFTVEVAKTQAEADKGLGGRTELAKDHGLLVDYRAIGKPSSPTMKGVTIGLDFLFLAPDGSITTIIANARPGSLRPLWTGLSYVSALEIPAGQAAALGLKPGDKVTGKVLGNAG